MRGFTRPHTATLTLHHGDEQVTYTLSARPAFFGFRLRWELLPPPAEPGADASESARSAYAHAVQAWAHRLGVLQLAESLRPHEPGLPPAPTTTDPDTWAAYADSLMATYVAAGLTDAELLRLRELSDRLTETVGIGQEMDDDDLKNSYAPNGAPTAAPLS